jgi:hypothetical protein
MRGESSRQYAISIIGLRSWHRRLTQLAAQLPLARPECSAIGAGSRMHQHVGLRLRIERSVQVIVEQGIEEMAIHAKFLRP